MSWVPSTDFEEEIVDLQPDHNFIFGELCGTAPQAFYPRPKSHLDFVAQKKNEKDKGENTATNSQNHKLNLIAKVQRIAGTKPLGEQPTIDDWDDNENLERETIAMMRHLGLGPNVEQPFDAACTIATHPITEEVKINRNGRKQMPIFFDEKFFELKPRISCSTSSPGNSSPIMEGAVSRDESSSSQRSSSLTTSNETNNDHTSDSLASAFESAADIVGDADSFETARNSDNGNIPQNTWGNKSKPIVIVENWRSVDNIKTRTYTNSNIKPQNRNKSKKQTIQNVCREGVASSDMQFKKKIVHKSLAKLCTPKELYDKKKAANDKKLTDDSLVCDQAKDPLQ